MPEIDDDDWEDDDEAEEIPCPSCGASVYEETEKCPHCGDWIDPRSRSARPKAWVWITAALLIAAFLWFALRGL